MVSSLIWNCFSRVINPLQTKRGISGSVDKCPVMRDDICVTWGHAPFSSPLHCTLCTAAPLNLGFGERSELLKWSLSWVELQPKLNLGHFESEIEHLVIIFIGGRRLCDIRNKLLTKYGDMAIKAGLKKSRFERFFLRFLGFLRF